MAHRLRDLLPFFRVRHRCRGNSREVLYESLESRLLLATNEGSRLSISEEFDRAGLVRTLNATIDWGDGTSASGAVSGGSGSPLMARIDYSLDTNGFFSGAANQQRRDRLEQAVNIVLAHLGDDLEAILPSGANTWKAVLPHPATGDELNIDNLSVAENELVIFAAGRDLGNTLANSGPGGFNVSCVTQTFCDIVAARGEQAALDNNPTDFGPWGGAISFNTTTDWHFGETTSGLLSTESDFLSVAIHEAAHVLGFGTSKSWNTFRSGGIFNGPASRLANGDASVALDNFGGHWADGTKSDNQEAAMDPTLTNGTRKLLTALDLAGLDDVGWQLVSTKATVTGDHIYADDGDYDVKVTLTGNNPVTAASTIQEEVTNVPPTLTVPANQNVFLSREFTITDIGSFSDPGFGSTETFEYSIDWDDSTPLLTGTATIDQAGGPLLNTTGSFDGTHTYAVPGTYSVTVSVADDDGGTDSQIVQITAQPFLTIDLADAAISEQAGSTSAVLTRHVEDLSQPLTVTLTGDASEVSIPSTITIQEGEASATISIAGVDDALLDGTQTVTITAAATDFIAAIGTLDVTDHETLLLSIDQNSIAENGGVATGSVTRSNVDDLADALTIELRSDDTSEVTVPSTVEIPANEVVATFTITAVDDDFVDGTQMATITATATGYTSGIQMLDVEDDGEVTFDFGDAPTAGQSGFAGSYPVTLAQDGARHPVGEIRLGTLIDSEADGKPDETAGRDGAGGDDNSDSADEDGVFMAASIVAANVATKSSFAVTSSDAAKLDAWIDFNQDGDWDDSDEQVFTSVEVDAGANLLSFDVPPDATPGNTAARFRISSSGGLTPTGAAEDGEVEDYIFTVLDGGALGGVAVNIDPPVSGTLDVVADGNDVVVRNQLLELFRAPGSPVIRLEVAGATGDDTLNVANLDAIFNGLVAANAAAGNDTLRLTGSDQSLDLTQLSDSDIQGIETIDITGDGNNMLKLSATEVANISATTDTLRVTSDEGDTVDIGTGWTFDKSNGTYVDNGGFIRVLTQGDATLELDGPYDWSNPVNSLDTDASGSVSPIDALLIINEINNPKFSLAGNRLPEAAELAVFPNIFWDAHPDGFVSPIDALTIVNFLNGPSHGGEAETIAIHTDAGFRNMTDKTLPNTIRIAHTADEGNRSSLGSAQRIAPTPVLSIDDSPNLIALRSSRIAGTSDDSELKDAIEAIFSDAGSIELR